MRSIVSTKNNNNDKQINKNRIKTDCDFDVLLSFFCIRFEKGPVFSLAIHFIHTQRKKNMAATQKWVSEPDLQRNVREYGIEYTRHTIETK